MWMISYTYTRKQNLGLAVPVQSTGCEVINKTPYQFVQDMKRAKHDFCITFAYKLTDEEAKHHIECGS